MTTQELLQLQYLKGINIFMLILPTGDVTLEQYSVQWGGGILGMYFFGRIIFFPRGRFNEIFRELNSRI